MTPVVAQELPFRDLLDVLLTVCGKDPDRIQELLLRGSVVQSASRFRWIGLDADSSRLQAALALFPDSDVSRVFDAGRCVSATLVGERTRVELPRELAGERRFLRRRSFWDVLMAVVAMSQPQYVEYSYRDHADRFQAVIDAAPLLEAAGLLTYSGLVEQVRRSPIDRVELLVTR